MPSMYMRNPKKLNQANIICTKRNISVPYSMRERKKREYIFYKNNLYFQNLRSYRNIICYIVYIVGMCNGSTIFYPF